MGRGRIFLGAAVGARAGAAEGGEKKKKGRARVCFFFSTRGPPPPRASRPLPLGPRPPLSCAVLDLETVLASFFVLENKSAFFCSLSRRTERRACRPPRPRARLERLKRRHAPPTNQERRAPTPPGPSHTNPALTRAPHQSVPPTGARRDSSPARPAGANCSPSSPSAGITHTHTRAQTTMAVDIRSTAKFGAYVKDRCRVIGARLKSDGTQVRLAGRSHKNRAMEQPGLLALVSLSPPLAHARARVPPAACASTPDLGAGRRHGGARA